MSAESAARGLPSHPVVLVVLEHADAVLDDEEEVDAGQRRQALPNPVKVLHHIDLLPRPALAVVVRPLRLCHRRGNGEGGVTQESEAD